MKNTYIKIVLVFIIELCNSYAYAQDLKFKRLSDEEGLSSVNVKSIHQDAEGFIWFGTQDGLNKYDGYHFTIYKSNVYDKASLASADINCITEDNETGKLYIGTNGSGLSVFDKHKNTFTNFNKENNNICNNVIKCICNISTTELLIGTKDGVSLFNKKTSRALKIPSPVKTTENLVVTAIFEDSFGTIWVSFPKYGMYKYNASTKSFDHILMPESITKNSTDYYKRAVVSISQIDNNLFLGTFNGGIITYDLSKNEFIGIQTFSVTDSPENNIRDMIVSQDKKHLWIATLGGLIDFLPEIKTYNIITNNKNDFSSIASNGLLSLLFDKQNNLWVGTESNGVCVNFNNTKNFSYFNKNQLSGSEIIYSFLETKDNQVWIGTEDGLYSFNKATNKFTNHSSIISALFASSVWSLVEDDFGNIWIGTYNEGIIVYNPKTKTTKKILPDNYCKDYVLKLVKDKNHIIWAGTYNYGVLKINSQDYSFEQYDTEDGLNSNTINDVFLNDDNTVWLGTSDAGINVLTFNSESKISVKQIAANTSTNSLSSNLVYSIIKGSQNTFWIATNNGLNSLKDGLFEVYTENDGLPSNNIYSIIEDSNKSLWLTTNNGLSNFSPKNKIKTGNSFINYNTINGIQAKEFNQGAAYKSTDGKILVGGMKGFNYFDPQKVSSSDFAPSIFIHSYSRQGNEIASDTAIYLKNNLNLKYKENFFTFEFVALDYSAPEKIKFKYKLEGYDSEWSAPTDVRYISYNELQGGTYVLNVKVTNSDGVWGEKPFKFTIKIIPPWYKTMWAYCGFFIAAFALVFGFIRYRTQSVLKENKILEVKVEERTHELAQKNRDITSSIEYAKRIQEAILPAQQLIFSKLKQAFILYKPKDIVSGDFYWFGEKNNYKIIGVVDCTGHGVPGAFMSMIGHNLLNQIVSEKNNYDPATILNELHKGVQAALKQGQNQIQTNDGMDVSLLAINTETNECLWAGAFRSLIIINEQGELEKIDGNKYPIGGAQLDNERVFTSHKRRLNKNDCLFMTSDGYADQFGGDNSKKFMVKRFNENLKSIIHLSSDEQRLFLEKQFDDWRGTNEQVDDVLVFGLKI